MYNVLVCDDEKDIANALAIYLRADGHEVWKALSGREALGILRETEIHLVLLDIMMPGMDGLQTLQRIRSFSNVPVLFLTAKSEEADMLQGLSLGADDYITKPFRPVEVQMRVRSHLRRYMQLGSGKLPAEGLRNGGIEMIDREKRVLLDGEEISLTRREYELLRFLLKNTGVVFSPDEIYRRVWREEPINCENTIAVHIRHLREKLEIDPGNPRYLRVVWGHGYKMEKILR